MSEKVNCLKCKYYHNTWDPQAPRGCSLMRFKGTQFPSLAVKRETGKECQGFVPNGREAKKQAKKGLDLNSDDLW